MIYASRPIWQTGGSFPTWAIPEWAANFRDMRTLDECGVAGRRDGDRSGLGLYIPIEGVTVKDDAAIPLGELDDVLSPEQKTALNVSEVRTLREAIVQRILFSDSPPTLKRGGKIEIGIGPQRIIIPMAPGTDGFDIVQSKTKAGILAAPPQKYAALITDRLEKLGVPVTRENAALYLGLDMEPGPKQTTKGDTFNRATDVSIDAHTPTGANAGTSWTLLGGAMRVDDGGAAGRAYANGGPNAARLHDAMSSADMETEADVNHLGTNSYGTVVVRKDSGATLTYYHGGAAPDASPDVYYIGKRVTGIYTTLATFIEAITANVNRNYRLRIVNDDLEFFVDGVSKVTLVNDTSISGNTYGGLDGGGGDFVVFRNFVVTDELGGGGAVSSYLTLLGVG